MIYTRYEDAVTAAKEKARLEQKNIRIISSVDGWYVEEENEPMNRFHDNIVSTNSRRKEFTPTKEPILDPVKVKCSNSPTPPEGVDLSNAISLLEWIINGLKEISSMKYISENSTYTDYAKKTASMYYRAPLNKLHGTIGDVSAEKGIGSAVDRFSWLRLQKSKSSVKSNIKKIYSDLEYALRYMRLMESKKVNTNCGIKYSTVGKKGVLSLYRWEKTHKSGGYNLSYIGERECL